MRRPHPILLILAMVIVGCDDEAEQRRQAAENAAMPRLYSRLSALSIGNASPKIRPPAPSTRPPDAAWSAPHYGIKDFSVRVERPATSLRLSSSLPTKRRRFFVVGGSRGLRRPGGTR